MPAIKDRILQIADHKGLNREAFLNDMGTSYSNYRGRSKHSSPSSEVIAKISTKHPDINIQWLLTGKGTMTISKIQVEEKATHYLDILQGAMETGQIDPQEAESVLKKMETLLVTEQKYETLKEKVRALAS